MSVTLDERGRVLIPRELREAYGLSPGSPVILEPTPTGIELRPALPKKEALQRLLGAIQRPARKAPDALAAKRIWERTP